MHREFLYTLSRRNARLVVLRTRENEFAQAGPRAGSLDDVVVCDRHWDLVGFGFETGYISNELEEALLHVVQGVEFVACVGEREG